MDARVLAAGDAAWLVELPERIDPEVNARAIDIASRISAARLPAVLDVVIGYRSVMVYFNPMADGAAAIEQKLRAIAAQRARRGAVAGASLQVPVCYDPPFGPDLPD